MVKLDSSSTAKAKQNHKHSKFVENLVNASHGRDLDSAAQEWQLDSVGKNKSIDLHCHLCNTHIVDFVILSNTQNQNKLIVGHDCYDKLLRFLTDGNVTANLPNRKKYLKELKVYWQKIIPDQSFLGWFAEQHRTGKLPQNIAAIWDTILQVGFAANFSDADTIVAFYKGTRLFPTEVFISGIKSVYHSKLFPKQITIDQVERVDSLVLRARKLKNYLSDWKRNQGYIAKCAYELHSQVHALLGSYQEYINGKILKGVEPYNTVQADFVLFQAAMLSKVPPVKAKLLPKELRSLEAFMRVKTQILQELEQWFYETRMRHALEGKVQLKHRASSSLVNYYAVVFDKDGKFRGNFPVIKIRNAPESTHIFEFSGPDSIEGLYTARYLLETTNLELYLDIISPLEA